MSGYASGLLIRYFVFFLVAHLESRRQPFGDFFFDLICANYGLVKVLGFGHMVLVVLIFTTPRVVQVMS